MLTPKQQRFVDEYLIDLSGAKAAVRAGFGAKNARQAAHNLLQKREVAEAINTGLAARKVRVTAESDRVVRELYELVFANAADVVEVRRTCCRYCYGRDNRYQRTAGEMERARAAYARDMRAARAKGEEFPDPFDEQGGDGWNPTREPSQSCRECFGEGVGSVHMHDSGTLIGGAARLFDGVEETKDGIKVRLRSRDKAIELLGRHLGMFNDKLILKKPKVRVRDFTGRGLKTSKTGENDE
ncbi:terminase small subunit [Caballeronia sp. GAFFF2]|uniref:terminase small subunit n=1 Tax=Caballeronia sp. GAFFF2 TaxID=2921741 RepID=UPI00202782C7|nr:terminase small subunit [Caballeronia sp. GAFFF2]